MKPIIIAPFAIAALLSLAACSGETGPSASAEVSPGGIAYTLIAVPEADDTVSIQIAWATDWAWRADVNQAAPYIGAQLVLAGGAEGYPAGEVGELFADLQSTGNLVPSLDHIVGTLEFKAEHMDETVEIANVHLRAPLLEKEWFDRIHEGFAQNLAEMKAQPANQSFDAARWAIFANQSVRDGLSLDAPGTVEGVTRDDIVAWRAETLTRDPQAIVVAGNLDVARAGAALDALLAGLPETSHDISRDMKANFSPRRILLHVPDAETTTLSFIAPLPSTELGGEFEDAIIAHALGGDDQSVLHEAVRTRLRASYGFGAGLSNYTRDARILVLSGVVETEKLADTENVVRDAYAAFRKNGPGGSLAERKADLEANLKELPKSAFNMAYSELQSALDGYAPGRSLGLGAELAAVSEESIAGRLANDYPQADAFLVIAVSPDAEALPGACVISTPQEALGCK